LDSISGTRHHLIEAIQASGHADFLADYVTNERKRVEIGLLEMAVWDPDSDEKVFQKILERNPWMFGGQYVATGQRTIVLGDQFDVPLITADGSLHLVELKRADASPIVRKDHNHWIVGGVVHEAVSQTQNYLRSLDEDRHRIVAEFGIDPRRLHATVVIGHIDQANSSIPMDTIYETLRTYNSFMSRITVMTYDQLVTNAHNALEMLGAPRTPNKPTTGRAMRPDPKSLTTPGPDFPATIPAPPTNRRSSHAAARHSCRRSARRTPSSCARPRGGRSCRDATTLAQAKRSIRPRS